MRLPVIVTKGHKGKALELDCELETITLLGLLGDKLGTVTWASVIDHIQASGEKSNAAEPRSQPRVSLFVKARHSTADGKRVESRATGIGEGGLFIETQTPLPVGTEVAIEFALPDRPSEWLEAKGRVIWICPKPDQYTSSPGMGVRFTQVSAVARERVLELVNSLKRTGRG